MGRTTFLGSRIARRPRRRRAALLGGVVVACLAAIGLVFAIQYWKRADNRTGPSNDDPKHAIVGTWVGELGEWEFTSAGGFTKTLRAGDRSVTLESKYRFVSADVIEVDRGGEKQLCDVFVSHGELRLYWHTKGRSLDELDEKAVGVDDLVRKAKKGQLTDPDRLNGGAAGLRQRLANSKWVQHQLTWDFNADRSLKRAFIPPNLTWKVTDNRTLEVRDPAGKRVREYEVYVGTELLRLHELFVDDSGKRTGRGPFYRCRPATAEDFDEPFGTPETMIVGEWRSGQDFSGAVPIYRFTNGGEFEAHHPNWGRPDRGKYKFRPDGSLELYWPKAHPSHNRVYRIAVGKIRLALTPYLQNNEPWKDDRVVVYRREK